MCRSWGVSLLLKSRYSLNLTVFVFTFFMFIFCEVIKFLTRWPLLLSTSDPRRALIRMRGCRLWTSHVPSLSHLTYILSHIWQMMSRQFCSRYPMRIYRLMITCIRLGAFPLLRDTFFLSVAQEGNRTHHFNPPLGWAPRLYRAINPQRRRWSNHPHYLFLF